MGRRELEAGPSGRPNFRSSVEEIQTSFLDGTLVLWMRYAASGRPTLKLLGCAVRLIMQPLHLASPPRPMALDLHPQRDAQEGADENDEPKDREVLDRGRDRPYRPPRNDGM